jgi:hypothetical protein
VPKSQRNAYPLRVADNSLILDLTEVTKKIKAATVIEKKDKNKVGE